MKTAKRDLLIDTALRLFDKHGYHVTGIDTILAEAGVAKMTLYNHFKSKDELIVAALQRRDEQWRRWFREEVEKRAAGPREQLLAMFDVLGDWFRKKDFHGCSFVRAATEFREPGHAVHELAAEHKRIVIRYMKELAAAAGAKEPSELAEQLCLLLEGAAINMELFRKPQVARTARKAVEQLLDNAID